MYGDAVEASYGFLSMAHHMINHHTYEKLQRQFTVKVINEDNFYTTSSKLQRTGQLKITLSVKK